MCRIGGNDAVLKSTYEFAAKALGVVEEGIAEDGEKRKGRYETLSRIRVFDEYADGLSGIPEYSHLIVIWQMHRAEEVKLRVKPRGGVDMPEVGIFATRFPPRPNPIGVSVVKLLTVKSNLLRVKGLDAWTGTPILDIKPYDYYDIIKTVKVPAWWKKHWGEHYAKWRTQR